MRTWERGAGLTQACGTGACAVLVAGVLTGKLGRAADISLPGGDLHIRWNDSAAGGRVLMTGPATEICEGQWPDEPARPARGEFPALRTERLLLRELTQADAPALRRHLLPKEVTDGMSSAQHPLPEGDEVRRIGRFRRIFNSGDGAIWGMVLPESGELVGVIGLNVDRKTERAMLGYTVSVPHWGKGFATEAGKSVIDHAFGSVGVAVVWAGRFGWNEASGRVLEKLGMTFDGAQRAFLKKNEVWQEDRLYSILRSEWEKSR